MTLTKKKNRIFNFSIDTQVTEEVIVKRMRYYEFLSLPRKVKFLDTTNRNNT